MKNLLSSLLLAFGLMVCAGANSPAQAQPCQWNYALVPQDPAGTATATYCGNVNVAGTISGGGQTISGLVVTPETYGGGASVTNNVAAVTSALAAIAARGGGTLWFGVSGQNYNLASASLAASLNVPNNTTVACAPGVTLTVTGASATAAIFLATNPINVYIGNNCTIIGNSQTPGNGSIGAVEFLGSGAAAVMSNFGSPNLTLRNFKQGAWVEVANLASFGMINATFDGMSCYSQAGNTFDPATQGSGAACLQISGQASNANGIIRNVSWRGGYIDASFIKFAALIFNTSNMVVDNTTCVGAGNGLTAGNHYGCWVYYRSTTGFDSTPQGFTLSNSRITGALNFGAYCVDARDCNFNYNYCSGIQDVTASIATACFQQSNTSGNMIGNLVEQSYGAAFYAIATDGNVINIAGNNVSNTLVAANTLNNAIIVDPGIGTSSAGTGVANLTGNTVLNTGTGAQGLLIRSVSASSSSPGTVNLLNENYRINSLDLYGHDSGSSALVATALNIKDSFFGGFTTNHGVILETTTTPINISNLTLDGAQAASSGIWGMDLNGASRLNIVSLRAQNFPTSQYVMDTRGAQGGFTNLSFINVTTSTFAIPTGLGTALPTFNANSGLVVKNLLPVEAGSAASKYTIGSWINASPSGAGTTWLEQRALTGN